MDVPFDEVKTWYGSEIELLVEAFLEVNSAFFAVARKLRVDGLVAEIIETVSGSLPGVFAGSFRQAMLEHGDMDGKSS